MEKIKQGKLDRPTFWLAVAVVWLLIIMLATKIGDVIGENGRIVVGIIALVIYIAACAMRLRDAGKSMGLILIMCIIPVYAFVIGCYKSEEPEWMKKDTENMSGEDSQ